MNEIILSDEIISRLEILGLDTTEMNMKVLKYFLTRNITSVLGNDKFDPELLEINTIKLPKEREVKKIENILIINFLGKEYIVYVSDKRNSLIMETKEKREIIFQISSCYNKMCNYVISNNDRETITEYQTVNLSEKARAYSYQKVVNFMGDEKVYPLYSLEPCLIRSKNEELFKLDVVPKIPQKKPLIKTLFDNLSDDNLFRIPIPEYPNDEFDYIKEIFDKLEEESLDKSFKLKRKDTM